MSKVQFGHGDTSVVVSSDFEEASRALLRRASRGQSDILEEFVEGHYVRLKRDWPISRRRDGTPRDKSHSIDKFEHGLKVSQDHKGSYVAGFVRNTASYLFYVWAFQSMFRKPMLQDGSELVRKLGQDLVRAHGEA